MKTEDVVIIGAGPAGIATAIQLKRWGLNPVLLEKKHVGGLLVNANLVENYPGFPGGIAGIDLVELMKSHLENVGAVVTMNRVFQLDYDKNFIIETSDERYRSKFVVTASGTKPKPFDGFEISPDVADRVGYEVYPIAGVEGKRIAVAGAGDAAFDYALNLARGNEVFVVNRGDVTKCLPLLWNRVRDVAGITYHENTQIQAIAKSENGVILTCEDEQGDWELAVDYVIFAIGRMAQLGFLSERLKQKASVLEGEGLLHFVGDVKNDIYRQTSIAVGDGVRAAMKICEKLQGAR